MKKVYFLIILFSLNAFACSYVNKNASDSEAQTMLKQSEQIIGVEKDLNDLKKKCPDDKNNDDKKEVINESSNGNINHEVLEAQRANYAISITTIIFLASLFIGLNFFSLRSDLNRKIEKEKEKLEKEISSKSGNSIDKMKQEIDEKFNKISESTQNVEDYLSLQIFNIIGRLYEEQARDKILSRSDYAGVCALWYSRELEQKLKYGSVDESIKGTLSSIKEMLERSSKISHPEWISEFNTIFSKLDAEKFGKEKEELKALLEKRIKEGNIEKGGSSK